MSEIVGWKEMLGMFALVSLFHVIGGVALGTTIRKMVDDFRAEGKLNLGRSFFLVWGGMFACIPLAFGLAVPQILIAQVAVIAIAMLVPFFWADRARELVSDPNVIMMLFGGVFFVAGMGGGAAMLNEREYAGALTVGCLFVLIGGGIFWYGFYRAVLKSPVEDEETEQEE
jgi:hypothetical protein